MSETMRLSRLVEQMVRTFLLSLLLCVGVPTAVQAQELAVRAAGELPPMAFYQLDGRAFWRLSDSVVTAEGGVPVQPRPVYVQFGSVSCEPCHRLAAWINGRLSSDVVRVYAHIDEVELAENAMPLGQLRRELSQQMASDESYSAFLTLVSVPLSLVQQVTGSVTLPGGLLILPDGRHVAFSGFDPLEVESIVRWFEQEWVIYGGPNVEP
jgi:hypothetical protein